MIHKESVAQPTPAETVATNGCKQHLHQTGHSINKYRTREHNVSYPQIDMLTRLSVSGEHKDSAIFLGWGNAPARFYWIPRRVRGIYLLWNTSQ